MHGAVNEVKLPGGEAYAAGPAGLVRLLRKRPCLLRRHLETSE